MLAGETLSESTIYERDRYVDDFREFCGEQLAERCRPIDLQDWVEQHAGWLSPYTQHCGMRCVMRAFNWAAKMGFILENPFLGVEWPECPETRRPMTQAEYERALAAAGPHTPLDCAAMNTVDAREPDSRSSRVHTGLCELSAQGVHSSRRKTVSHPHIRGSSRSKSPPDVGVFLYYVSTCDHRLLLDRRMAVADVLARFEPLVKAGVTGAVSHALC